MSSQEGSTKVANDSAVPKGIGSLLGAVFLMATSSIGPGFLTQTSVFTVRLGAAFAFAILISILVDVAIQLNVWRVLGISGLRANELGNSVIPGLGWVMSLLVFAGGVIFGSRPSMAFMPSPAPAMLRWTALLWASARS